MHDGIYLHMYCTFKILWSPIHVYDVNVHVCHVHVHVYDVNVHVCHVHVHVHGVWLPDQYVKIGIFDNVEDEKWRTLSLYCMYMYMYTCILVNN